MAENREKILEEACHMFQQKGFDGVTVAEVMRAAGLTHGAFYGHFRSKEDLIAQILRHRCEKMREAKPDLESFLDAYLSPGLCDDPSKGCHIPALAPALGPDMVHHSPEARAALTESIRVQIDRLGVLAPGAASDEQRRIAIRTWAAMVGAVVLAKACDDPALAGEILAEVRAGITVGP
ncbi:TetR/AcrR family transcriptional regulator [Pseudogemmobacter bohemicus]|uniref:TetR/AcrR family transcriptional regulator n=1 Tax=Pseudogemmobacter bohemicus TaxID=2250708 RepID=UPI0022B81BF4|nr:TetR/AcrR family transcriptional regulator [Pseudogemmobacter bohemicus]